MCRKMITGVALCAFVGVAMAGNNLVYYPGDGITDTTPPVGVAGDAAPGFDTGSFAGNGATKTAILMDPVALFGYGFNVGDIESMSFWTKQGVGFTDVNPYLNWYLEVYTAADGTDDDSWYGRRLNMEPYFAINPSAPANTWTEWSTDLGTNQLRVFDANRGASGPIYGTYTDPTLADLTAGPVDWNSYYSGYDNTPVDYRNEAVWFMGISTGSGWAAGFDGQVDGFTITLVGGDTATVNFEVPEPASLTLLALAALLIRRR